MAKINGKGAPTRKTIGGLGDIYTDTNTGNVYECIFAYRTDDDSDFDCQWKYTGNVEVAKDEKESVKKNDRVEEVKEVKEDKPVKEVKEDEPAEEVKEEQTKTSNNTNQRTNYAAYSKKKN